MNANELDWGAAITPNIGKAEFPAGVLASMSAGVVLALSDLRKTVGKSLFPSPVYAAHVRHTSGNSRHETKGGTRLSDATDFFCSWDAAPAYLEAAKAHPGIGAVGIYTDMVFRGSYEGDYAMLHIDMRERDETLVWVGWRESRRHPTQYVYQYRQPDQYANILRARGGIYA